MLAGVSMTKEINAVYEQGNAAEILAEIAALPLEGSNDAFAGREHDSILYPRVQDSLDTGARSTTEDCNDAA